MTRYALLIAALLPFSAFSQKNTSFKALFYNVENLFDTIDDPAKDDKEYLPTAKKQWDTKKYFTKLNQIGQVISETGFPEIVGLSEIENRVVLEDLIKTKNIKGHNYTIIHAESPDNRGIDVAILVNGKQFKTHYTEAIKVTLPGDSAKPTRDILYTKLVYSKDTLHVFANHWPSRNGGEERSEPNRIVAAKTLAVAKDSIVKNQPNAKLLIMGDFNDYPTNVSLKDFLGAATDPALAEPKGLVNLCGPLFSKGEGSDFYKEKWTMLINMIVSTSLLKSTKGFKAINAEIFKKEFLLYKNNKTGIETPNRTYLGDKYVGGYSDHLPVLVNFVWNK